MADTNNGPYESVKNRRTRAPNKRPYDSFAEGELQTTPAKIQNHASEVPSPPTEQNAMMDSKQVEDDRRALLRSIIGNLNRSSLEDLLVDAGVHHKAVMASVIAANRKGNWRSDEGNGIGNDTATIGPQHSTSTQSTVLPDVASSFPSFVTQYSHHITSLTAPKPYTTPYPPLVPIPTSNKISKKSLVTPVAPSTPKSRIRAKPKQVQSAPAAPVGTPKATKKAVRPYIKKSAARGPGRLPKGVQAEKGGELKTASGRSIKRTRYTEPDTEEDEEEEDDDEEIDDSTSDTEVEDFEENEKAEKAVGLSKKNKRTPLPTSNSDLRHGKHHSEKSKDQTMIPVGVVAGVSNVALAGFDRRMGLIFRTSRYNRDGDFVGLGGGLSRSIKRGKVDFHPVLANLSEEELRKEILRRQTKIGYAPPPGKDLTGKPGQLVV